MFHDHTYSTLSSNTLSIASLNVCGLKRKIDLGIFENHIHNFDILCTCETKVLNPDDEIIIPGYVFIPVTKKNVAHKYGGIHGIGVYVKQELSNLITPISDSSLSSDCVLWLHVHEKLLGFNFIVGAVYIPHEQSRYYDNDIFDILSGDIVNLNSKFDIPICLTGDFNARTSTLDDFITLEDGVNNNDLSLIESNSFVSNQNLDALGIEMNRLNCDKKTNNNGYKLVELCKNFDLHILNGRFENNNRKKGDFTFVSPNGNSTIDYTLLSACMIPNIKVFKVYELDKCLSDNHKTICTVLSAIGSNTSNSPDLCHNIHKTSINDNSNTTTSHISTKWCASKSNVYINSFSSDDITNLLDKLNEIHSSNDVKHDDIDSICNDLCNLLIAPAIKSGVTKDVSNKKRSSSHYNKIKVSSNKPWFDNKCIHKRAEYMRLKNKLSKINTTTSNAKLKLEAQKYKKFIKKTKNKYYKELSSKLRNLKSINPKEYWKIINNANNKAKNKCPIDTDTLFNHFKNLGNNKNDATNDVNNSFDPRIINHSINEFINNSISLDEVIAAKNKLKSNKACGPDHIINEFIKNCPDSVLILITKIFNIVFDTGLIPDKWCLGIIIPIYKNKGTVDDPNNYRGITLLSCLGKLFTSVLNNRLTKYIDNTGLLGEDQAGFRANYSTMDHVFTLKSIIDLYLSNKKKLYCAFVDYKKAFDLINRTALWLKLIENGINGKIITVIFNLYNKAKSCIKSNNTLSSYFECNTGVRQGENLSPLLFALFINDLESSLRKDGVQGLNYINTKTIEYLSDDDVEMWLRLYVLLYADDTIILAESASDLQKALDSLYNYCQNWNLTVNDKKTKIVIFSRGKCRLIPTFTFGDSNLEVCDDYTYLGVIFNYNGKFNKAINKQTSQAKHAMFALLTKAAKLHLPTDVTSSLFDTLVLPILLYGCEIWGLENIDHVETFYRNFLRRLLKVNKLTVNCIVYGEVGKYKLQSTINKKMINFWSKIVTGKETKYSNRLYSLINNMHMSNTSNFTSKWIVKIKDILDSCGLSYIWLAQGNHNSKWLKHALDRRLYDIDLQNWTSDVHNNRFCTNYSSFKENLDFEFYLINLDYSNRVALSKLRCGNIKLPNNLRNFTGTDIDKTCKLCSQVLVGDEFHYLFICSYFNLSRSKYINIDFRENSNIQTMYKLFNAKNTLVLTNLCRFAKIISSNFL